MTKYKSLSENLKEAVEKLKYFVSEQKVFYQRKGGKRWIEESKRNKYLDLINKEIDKIFGRFE